VNTKLVKDLMVPLSAYATVPEDATLSDAVAALEESQANFNPHRAILVYNKNNDIVGKISMLSVLRGLEPKYDDMLSDKSLMHVGFTRHFQKIMIEQLELWESPLEHLCEKAARVKVKAFMHKPHEAEFIEVDATLDEAIHQLVIGCHQSLLVTEDKKVVWPVRDILMEEESI
jgi:CBS domain containing-hemolysin-like protein